MATTYKLKKGTAGTDLSATTLDSLVFTHGRRVPYGNIPPNTLTATLVRKSPTPAPSAWSIGEQLVLELTTPGAGGGPFNLFQGQITDIGFDRDFITVTATSEKLAGWGRVLIDGVASGAGTTTSGALTYYVNQAAAAGAKGVGYTSSGLRNVTHDLAAVTQVNALTQFLTVLSSEWNGVLVEWKTSLEVMGEDWRRPANMGTARKFDWSTIGNRFLRDWKFTKRVGDKTNRCTVTAPAPSSSAISTTYSDTADITTSGTYATTKATTLDTLDLCDQYARNEVKHFDTPLYTAAQFTIDLAALTDAQRIAVFNGMYCGAYLKTPTIDAALPVEWFVEGLRLTITRGGTWLDIYPSDLRLTVAGQRWSDITSGVTWATVNAAYTWDDVLVNTI